LTASIMTEAVLDGRLGIYSRLADQSCITPQPLTLVGRYGK